MILGPPHCHTIHSSLTFRGSHFTVNHLAKQCYPPSSCVLKYFLGWTGAVLYIGAYYVFRSAVEQNSTNLFICVSPWFVSGRGGWGREKKSRAEAVCTFPSWDGWPWQIASCNVSNALYAVLTADYPRGLRWEEHVIGAEQSQDPGQTVMCQRTATDPWLGHEHGQDATLWRTLRTALDYTSPSYCVMADEARA